MSSTRAPSSTNDFAIAAVVRAAASPLTGPVPTHTRLSVSRETKARLVRTAR